MEKHLLPQRRRGAEDARKGSQVYVNIESAPWSDSWLVPSLQIFIFAFFAPLRLCGKFFYLLSFIFFENIRIQPSQMSELFGDLLLQSA